MASMSWAGVSPDWPANPEARALQSPLSTFVRLVVESSLITRMWRNWQTRKIQVLVGVKSRGGSSPLIRTFKPRFAGLFSCPDGRTRDIGCRCRRILRWCLRLILHPNTRRSVVCCSLAFLG